MSGSTPTTVLETQNLYGAIDRDNVFGSNLTVPEDAREVIKPWDQRESVEKSVESGVDDQVMLDTDTLANELTHAHIAHHTHPICAKCSYSKRPAETWYVFCDTTIPLPHHRIPARGELCPHRLRVYANHPTGVGFDDAETYTPQLDIALLESEVGVMEYPVPVPSFTNIHALTLFFVRPPVHPHRETR